MVVHLLVNASLLSGATTFQKSVYQIHGLENMLLLVEWAFIFGPILFHAIIGLLIIWGGVPNNNAYQSGANYRYTLQRATGIIALAFIIWHVFHLHGWFHFDWWLDNVAEPLNGGNFKPFNAASTLGAAMTSTTILALYAIGVLVCVFHLANGIWTMGITWGAWISPGAQQRALRICATFGVLLAVVGIGALVGASTVSVKKAWNAENDMYEARENSGDIKHNDKHNDHKRALDLPEP